MSLYGYVHYAIEHVDFSDISALINRENQATMALASKVSNTKRGDLTDLENKLMSIKQLLADGKAGYAVAANQFGIDVNSVLKVMEDDTSALIREINLEKGGFDNKRGIAKFASITYANGGGYVRQQLNKLYSAAVGSASQIPDNGQASEQVIRTLVAAVNTNVNGCHQALSKTMSTLINGLGNKSSTAIINMSKKLDSVMAILNSKQNSGKNTRVFQTSKGGLILRDFLNECISILAPMQDYVGVQGRFLEDLVEISRQVYDNVAQNAAETVIDNLAKPVGDQLLYQSIKNRYNKNKETDSAKTLTQGCINYTVTGTPSQRKVDAIVNVNNTMYQATIKNYTFKKTNENSKYYRNWVATTSDQPLTTLMEAGDTKFNTAYANLFADHGGLGGKKGRYKIITNSDGGNSQTLAQLRHQYLKILQLNMAVSSLIGSDQRISKNNEGSLSLVNDQANILIINDASTGRIRVIPTSEIIQRLYDLVQKGGSAASVHTTIGEKNASTETSLVVKNEWIGDNKNVLDIKKALQRSYKVWGALEEQKISISINLNTILGI